MAGCPGCMMLPPALRKALLVFHVSVSVGWLGAVAAFLALAVAAASSTDPEFARACTRVLEFLGWAVLLPLSAGSLVTGIIQSLGTHWGLFRHYWVLAKLAINVVASAILLMYMQTLTALADGAAGTASTAQGGHHGLQEWSPVLHSSGALVLLLLAVVLSVYKPKGLTRHGQRTRGRAPYVRP